MMNRILLAYDGSPYAEHALGELPKMGLDPLVEVSVVSVIGKPAHSGEIRQAEKQAKHVSSTIHGMMPQAKLNMLIRQGSPAVEIISMALVEQVQLIVLGAHGKSAVESLLFGSVSMKVAAEAACSVRICHRSDEPGFQHLRLTLAIDGSLGSELALEQTLQRSWPQGTGFHVVTIDEPSLPRSKAAQQELVARSAHELEMAGFFAKPVVLSGDPVKALLEHARNWAPHCILMGATGVDHGTRARLGSLATEMVKQGDCSVEIMRPGLDE